MAHDPFRETRTPASLHCLHHLLLPTLVEECLKLTCRGEKRQRRKEKGGEGGGEKGIRRSGGGGKKRKGEQRMRRTHAHRNQKR